MKKLLTVLLLLVAGATHAQISASDSALLASLPPLPDIDTTASPADAFTLEVKKLLMKTNAMTAAAEGIKNIMDIQRKNPNAQVPQVFIDRFKAQIDNGRVTRLLENMIIRIYRSKFSLEDLREINKFYDTPVGKKFATETVNIMNASMMEGQKIGQYIGLETARDLIKEGKWK